MAESILGAGTGAQTAEPVKASKVIAFSKQIPMEELFQIQEFEEISEDVEVEETAEAEETLEVIDIPEVIVVPEAVNVPEELEVIEVSDVPEDGLISEKTQTAEAMKVSLRILPDDFTVCQITDPLEIPFSDTFVFVSKTDEELSLVCRTKVVPWKTKAREDGWRAIRMEGILDFGLVGILAGLASILAGEAISIFAVSTYNTDYVLLKEDKLEQAKSVLCGSGYCFL